MKLIKRYMLLAYFLIFTFCFLPIHAEGADKPGSVMDMIPYESLAYISISNLDAIHDQVIESPEWEELLNMEAIQEELDQVRHALSNTACCTLFKTE